MTKKRTSGPGRGQEEFEGDIRAAFGRALGAERERRERARARAYREALDRARRGSTGAPGGRASGPLRPFAVGWRWVAWDYRRDQPVVQAMGRSVMHASSEARVKKRAAQWIGREVHRPPEGFEIRYIKEIT